jgi:predicted HicB family RNase H-like nuclease
MSFCRTAPGFCEEIGKKPQKPFKGKILARIEPELHKKAALIALQKRISLNKFVESAIKHEVELNLLNQL